MPAIPSGKMCRLCGLDVSQRPRVKDGQGHYYCQPCYDRAAQAAKEGVPVVARPKAPPPPPKGRPASSGALLDDLADLEQGAEVLDDGPPCTECGAPMARGSVLCTACGFHRQMGRRLSAAGAASSGAIVGAARPVAARPAGARRASSGGGSGFLDDLSKKPFLIGVAVGVVQLGCVALARAVPEADPVASGVSSLVALGILIWVLVKAFGESVATGLLSLFCLPYTIYFVFSKNDDVRLKWAFGVNLLCSVIVYVMVFRQAIATMQGGVRGGLNLP